MSPEQIVDLIRQMLFIALELSLPLLIVAFIIGFGVSIFQSLTQVQEQTLSFIPKIVGVVLALWILSPWMIKTIVKYTHYLWQTQWERIVNLASYAQ